MLPCDPDVACRHCLITHMLRLILVVLKRSVWTMCGSLQVSGRPHPTPSFLLQVADNPLYNIHTHPDSLIAAHRPKSDSLGSVSKLATPTHLVAPGVHGGQYVPRSAGPPSRSSPVPEVSSGWDSLMLVPAQGLLSQHCCFVRHLTFNVETLQLLLCALLWTCAVCLTQ